MGKKKYSTAKSKAAFTWSKVGLRYHYCGKSVTKWLSLGCKKIGLDTDNRNYDRDRLTTDPKKRIVLVLASRRDANRVSPAFPVVALRLPPKNCLLSAETPSG